MRAKRGEAGFTLVELLIASAVAALIVGLLSAATFQFLTATGRGHDRLAVLRDHGTAFQWLNRDVQMAVPDQATVLPTSVTLNWTDAVTGTTYESSYVQSGDELVRTLTVDGGTPSSQTVARNLAPSPSGFSVSLTDDLLTVSVTSAKGDTSQTRTESILMRAVGATVAPMRLATGSYPGNGADNRQITGVGFRPDVVIVKSAQARAAIIRTSTMTGDAAKNVSSAGLLAANLIQSLDTDGFTVGSSQDVNWSGYTYYWVAMKTGSNLSVGTYVGNGIDNRSITGVGLQPVWVITMGNGDQSVFRPASVSGDNSYLMTGTTSQTNRIQALQANGFQVGSNVNVNESGTTFHYIAWAASAQVVQTTYTGNGTDNRSIASVGFQPQMVWVKRSNANQSVWRPASVSGDSTLYFNASAATTNRIQALQADGFQVGTNNEVNQNSQTYHYLALRDGGS